MDREARRQRYAWLYGSDGKLFPCELMVELELTASEGRV